MGSLQARRGMWGGNAMRRILLWLVTIFAASMVLVWTLDVQALQDMAAGTPATGTWSGTAYFGPAENPMHAGMTFEVREDLSITGEILFRFEYENMSIELDHLVRTQGCALIFTTLEPESDPVSGYFIDTFEALGQFKAMNCHLDGYGELVFARPVIGVWRAQRDSASESLAANPPVSHTEVSPAAIPAAATSAQTPPRETTTRDDPALLSMGAELFLDTCSECHGTDAAGAPGVPDLTSREVQRQKDAAIIQTIRMGVAGTEMTPYRALLSEEQINALVAVIRNPDVLK